MKKIISIILILIFPISLFGQNFPQKQENETYEMGYLEGKSFAGEQYSSAGWFFAGFGGGFVLGLIGGGIVIGISQSGTVEPSMSHRLRMTEKSDEYKMGFCDGYSKRAKNKKLASSIFGALVGTTAIVLILMSATSND